MASPGSSQRPIAASTSVETADQIGFQDPQQNGDSNFQISFEQETDQTSENTVMEGEPRRRTAPPTHGEAVLSCSTNSDAVPDHQEASSSLQENNTTTRPRTSLLGHSEQISAHSATNNDQETEGETKSASSAKQSLSSPEEMRQALRFFFMDPLEKYHVTRQFPWKLSLQVLKIIIVTSQLIMFGDMRMGHAIFAAKTQRALRHLFLPNWASERDLIVYPSVLPPFAIYEMDDFYSHLTYAIKRYYVLPNVSVATLVYDCHRDRSLGSDEFMRRPVICPAPPLKLCIVQLREAESNLSNRTYRFDMRTVTKCIDLDLSESEWNSTSFSVKDALASQNVTIRKERFVKAMLNFKLKTIHLKRLQLADEPDCFRVGVSIDYDNSAHTGDILVVLDTVQTYINCEGSIQFPTYNLAISIIVALLDAIVLVICVASFILCLRAVIRADRLFKRANQFFLDSYGHNLSKSDYLKFINFWYLLILVNDVCLILGTVFKLTIEHQRFDSALFTATGMLLGLGTLIVWMGVLRYLALFPKYNVLLITIKRSLPNVLRFMACAGLLYAGFVFCGWVVLGPYHIKFHTLMMTSECLFALLNGDDLFATFTTTSNSSSAVLWFARIYFYTFISLFTYVVLSLFISIIMEAYEVMKDGQQFKVEHSALEAFINGDEVGADNDTGAGNTSVGGFPPGIRQRTHHEGEGTYAHFEDDPVTEDDSDRTPLIS